MEFIVVFMKNTPFDFHGTKMTIQVSTSETGGAYCVIHFVHPPNVGPALHMHPQHPETFHVFKGNYKFLIGEKHVDAKAGDTLTVPKGTPHKFSVGSDGGEFLVIGPPDLDSYFYETSQLSTKGKVDWEVESAIAKKYGQVFLENTNHW